MSITDRTSVPSPRGLVALKEPDRGRLMLLLLFHVLLGFLAGRFHFIMYVMEAGVLLWGLITIINHRDNKMQAAMAAAYFCGIEVLLRMTGTNFYWEIGKYGVIFLLGLGLLFGPNKTWAPYVLYFVLLLPSIAVSSYPDFDYALDQLSFNLSGPICLAATGAYFYKRRISFDRMIDILRAIAWPIIATLAYIVSSGRDLTKIKFESNSNFAASAGFGPNQVSLILSVGIFIVFILLFYKARLSGLQFLDYFIIFLLLFRALLTFSRGGVIGTAVATAVFLWLYALIGGKVRNIYSYIGIIILVAIAGFYVWSYTNELTLNALQNRYLGIDSRTGLLKKNYTSGRTDLLLNELEAFKDNPILGVGPGMLKLYHQKVFGVQIPTHAEASRLLAEHGLFGIVAFFLMIYIPIRHIYSGDPSFRPLALSILCLVVVSTFHAAMRLAVVPFIYGLTLVTPYTRQTKLSRPRERVVSQPVEI